MKKSIINILVYTLIFMILLVVLSLYVYFIIPILTEKVTTTCNFNDKGEIGDAIGGMTAPIIGLFSAFLVYIAFREQVKANKELEKQNIKLNFENVFFNFISSHRENVNSLSLDDSKGKYVFNIIITEFHLLYNQIDLLINQNLKFDENIDEIEKIKLKIKITYEFLFYGLDERSFNSFIKDNILKYYSKYTNLDEKILNNLFSSLCNYKKLQEQYFKVDSEYFKEYDSHFTISNVNIKSDFLKEYNRPPKNILNYRHFIGHQVLLSNYYRNMFNAYSYLLKQDEKYITTHEKKEYSNYYRSQLTNLEITLFMFNAISRLGYRWKYYKDKDKDKDKEINIVLEYELIKNIDISRVAISKDKVKKLFPNILFDFDGRINQDESLKS